MIIIKNIFIVVTTLFLVTTFFIIYNRGSALEKDEHIDREYRGIYLSYIEVNNYFLNKDKNSSIKNIKDIIDKIRKDKFNLLILHVRSFSDSIYPSIYFDNKFNYDLLSLFIDECHKYDIKIYAWINPYRISNLDNYKVNDNNSILKYVSRDDIKTIKSKGVFLNPASSNTKNLIVNGIIELVKKYDIDGIHFDDYFYPSNDIDIDLYNKTNKSMSLKEYHMYNVLDLLKNVYSSIKKINSNVKFSIAPEGNIDNNYDSIFLDIKKILSDDGYIDYIMPQLYYGFNNSSKPFVNTINEWNSLINNNVKIIPVFCLYKSGYNDNYAGVGNREWIDNNDIVKRQIVYSRNLNNYLGFSLFRYDYFYDKNKLNKVLEKEIINIRDVLY